jgi:hypothetical protein
MLKDIVDDKSYDGLLRHIINPKFDELEHSLRSKADELLEPQRKGHPITYNHYFTDCVQKARETHLRKSFKKKLREFFPSPEFKQSSQESHTFDIEELVAVLSVQTETDMEKFACSEATDCMMAYYKVWKTKSKTIMSLTAFCVIRSRGKSLLMTSAISQLRNAFWNHCRLFSPHGWWTCYMTPQLKRLPPRTRARDLNVSDLKREWLSCRRHYNSCIVLIDIIWLVTLYKAFRQTDTDCADRRDKC